MTSQIAYVISSGKVVGPRNETENVISFYVTGKYIYVDTIQKCTPYRSYSRKPL